MTAPPPAAGPTPEIRTTSSTEVCRNRWMRVREDRIVRADGSPGLYGVIEKQDFALIAPIEDGHVWLVEQYRYPVGRRYWELPQGSWEDRQTDPLQLARAELQEETGLRADTMRHIARLYLAYGMCNQAYDIFLASGLCAGERALDAEEQGLVARRFALAEVLAMVDDGRIMDASTVAAFGLLRLKGLV